jgi:hypothetical protein
VAGGVPGSSPAIGGATPGAPGPLAALAASPSLAGAFMLQPLLLPTIGMQLQAAAAAAAAGAGAPLVGSPGALPPHLFGAALPWQQWSAGLAGQPDFLAPILPLADMGGGNLWPTGPSP